MSNTQPEGIREQSINSWMLRSRHGPNTNRVGDKVLSGAGTMHASPEIALLNAVRDSRNVMCCQLFTSVLSLAMIGLIAFYLSEDSNTVDIMSQRALGYMDEFDKTRMFDLLNKIHNTYDERAHPTIIRVLDTTDKLTGEMESDDIAGEMHQFAQEFRQWMNHVNHVLNSTALRFNIEL